MNVQNVNKRELASTLKSFLQTNCKLISSTGNDDLVELDNKQLLIVNLIDRTVHTALQRDGGIDFEYSSFIKDKLLSIPIVLHEFKYEETFARLDRIRSILSKYGPTFETGWSEIDRRGKLSLIHYNDNADMSQVGQLRGILIDVERGLVIGSSYGFTPTVRLDNLSFVDGQLTVQDEQGYPHTFCKNDIVIKKCYEGVIMRVVFYEGECLRFTHKKIRPLKSRWATATPLFTKMYQDAGAPRDTDLFNVDKLYSPWCYTFLIVHPSLLMATKLNVEKPFAVFLNVERMWSQLPDVEMSDCEFEQVHSFDNAVLLPKELTVEEANDHLKFGYHHKVNSSSDPRNSCGESVIVYNYLEGRLSDVVKINSLAYDHRFQLRGSDPNLYHQFFVLMDSSQPDLTDYIKFQDFTRKFINYQPVEKSSVPAALEEHIGTIEPFKMTELRNKDYIMYQIWLNFCFALPKNHQSQAIGFLDQYLQERNEIINWLLFYCNNKNQLWTDGEQQLSKVGMGMVMNARNENHLKMKVYKMSGVQLFALIKHRKNLKK